MTTVFVVFHNDIEDSKWVRGVFATRELAEAVCPMTEDRWGDIREHFPVQRADGGWESLCCGVETWELADRLPEVYHGPEEPDDPEPSDAFLPVGFMESMLRDLLAPSPLR